MFETPLKNLDVTVSKLSIAHDVTEDKRVEEALRASEEKYRELFENAGSIILRTDPKGNITFFNELAQRFFGCSESEILGRNIGGAIACEEGQLQSELMQRLQTVVPLPEQSTNVEEESILPGGRKAWVAWNIKALVHEDGSIREFLCVGMDITERK